MATFTSGNRVGLTARALLFSGRPDPEWSLDPEGAAALITLLAAAPPTEAAGPVPPPLGYRGVRLTSDRGEASWDIYGGVVVEGRAGYPSCGRLDPDRTIERAVLATAPAGVLPQEWLEHLLEPRRE